MTAHAELQSSLQHCVLKSNNKIMSRTSHVLATQDLRVWRALGSLQALFRSTAGTWFRMLSTHVRARVDMDNLVR
jgi:hypothetical protein